MSKVLKALERAEREKIRSLSKTRKDLKQKGVDEDEEDVLELIDLIHPIEVVPDPKPSPDGKSPWLIVYSDPESMVAEQIKRIRTYILHFSQNNSSPRTIMITSTLPGEGKSLIAGNLAVSLAQGLHEYVLLVDSDIRAPQIQNHFCQSQGLGLSDYLNGETELSKIIRPSGIPKLSYIPGGRKKPNPVELLSSKRMREMVQEVKDRYEDRYILFDSSPVLLTNEPAILAKLMDGVLFIVRQGQTPRDALQKALGLIIKEKIIGLVFNDYETTFPSSYGYGYSYRRYYGKYYGKGKKGKRK